MKELPLILSSLTKSIPRGSTFAVPLSSHSPKYCSRVRAASNLPQKLSYPKGNVSVQPPAKHDEPSATRTPDLLAAEAFLHVHTTSKYSQYWQPAYSSRIIDHCATATSTLGSMDARWVDPVGTTLQRWSSLGYSHKYRRVTYWETKYQYHSLVRIAWTIFYSAQFGLALTVCSRAQNHKSTRSLKSLF